MKKAILFMFVMITLSVSNSTAQSNILLASNELGFNENHNDPNSFSDDEVNYSTTSTSKSYDIPESASTFNMSTTGILNINVNSNVRYTKAEILSKDSNTTKQSLPMNSGNKSVDISDLNSGTYYMILSNEAGDVFSEKIIIL